MKYLSFIILLFSLSCNSQYLTPLDKEIELSFNNLSTFIDGSSEIDIIITSIEDSRCPADADCIRSGEVIVTLAINDVSKNLCLGCNEDIELPNKMTSGGRTYTLIEVSPFPSLAQPSAQKDKLVKLKVD